ncbi:SDR family oxidoreductase [Pseudomonas savastanoi pv. phaseolicola]|uniref:SDR family oxidoreductase n=1 Tax=Pseudomonas savastanoi TaxID=29438 RepID=UPI0002E000F7|nr:SDR family oxidoreductase [Pseudomonas savastanoi]MBN3468922.1 SDR family oxidoreductase [Pseudomonas savastanoi pv. phaseolicola]MBN3476025.1 SDR family oxidoreductase [Pseudomonas savastanoi pv. phaseolicola]RMO06291.1 Oxidoreductase, short-chain dehydrogenase/reductase family [Pseudomonas savastanoi pv. phaseolicola]
MKKILIIGATSAIAHACARLWAAQGCDFFLVARDMEKLDSNAADLKARGAGRIDTHRLDVTHFSEHPAIGTLPDQKACEQYAGLAIQEFITNGASVIALLTLLARHFEVQRCGTLAVLSSVAGDRGRPSNYLYGSAKAAVSTFCDGLQARMFKFGVHVVTIKPGFVDTPMTHGLPLPALLVAQPAAVAERIVKGIARRSTSLYAPGFWAWIMWVIRAIPQPLFKRLDL